MSDAERFWSKVERRSDDECWPWKAGLSHGYGCFYATQSDGTRKNMKATRFMFALAYGREPKLFVLHSCDNPICVNPRHLREGTHDDNMRDRSERGRAYGGEDHHSAQLNYEIAESIREVYAEGSMDIWQLAETCQVSTGTIYSVLRGERWNTSPHMQQMCSENTASGAKTAAPGGNDIPDCSEID